MVSFYKLNGELRKIFSPFHEKVMFFIVMAVKHVADNNYLFRFIQLQLCYQPLHVFFKYCLGYGDP